MQMVKGDSFLYMYLQERKDGGTRLHAADNEELANIGRAACARAGIATSEVVAVPSSLAEHSAFVDTLCALLAADKEYRSPLEYLQLRSATA